MRLLLALLPLLLTNAVAAGSALKAADGWIRETPPTAPVRAGYLVLRNAGDGDLAVTGARSDAFGAVEIHEMAPSADGTMRMRPVKTLTVPAGGSVELKPGGLHLMLFRPQRPLAAGDRVPLILQLADGGELHTELEQR